MSSSALGGSRKLPSEIVAAAGECGRVHGVSGALHPNDYIFWFIHDDLSLQDKTKAPERYIESGKPAALLLKNVLAEDRVRAVLDQRPDLGRPVKVLEFASGYGRVSRHFPTVLPEAEVVACDIHDEAVDFLEEIGLPACKSSHVPEALQIGRTFDVIFVLSFFTHMPRSTWRPWLKALARHLSPIGILVITTHGEVSQPLMGVSKLETMAFSSIRLASRKISRWWSMATP
jgi:SAM-dependent methyltransferase